jgi:RNA polymerase sigma factor (sigma-70 family)
LADRTCILTAGMAAGETAAIDEFYRTYFSWLYREARHITGRDESFCLDVVQDATLRIVRCIKPVESQGRLKAWLRLVIKTAAYDLLRAERRHARHLAAAAMAPRGAAPPEEAGRSAWLAEQLAALDPQLVTLIELRYREGWTLHKIAEHLGLSIGTIDGRLRRALGRLQQSQGEHPDD